MQSMGSVLYDLCARGWRHNHQFANYGVDQPRFCDSNRQRGLKPARVKPSSESWNREVRPALPPPLCVEISGVLNLRTHEQIGRHGAVAIAAPQPKVLKFRVRDDTILKFQVLFKMSPHLRCTSPTPSAFTISQLCRIGEVLQYFITEYSK
jgi:hypothetical protein